MYVELVKPIKNGEIHITSCVCTVGTHGASLIQSAPHSLCVCSHLYVCVFEGRGSLCFSPEAGC